MKLRFQMGSNKAVGETERQDVLGGLLAQEVIDAEDLPLPKGFVHEVVELRSALARSVPNGFSITTRERSTRFASFSMVMTA